MNIIQLLTAIYNAIAKTYEAAMANNKYLEDIYDMLHTQIPISEPNAPVGAETKDENVDGGKKSKDEL